MSRPVEVLQCTLLTELILLAADENASDSSDKIQMHNMHWSRATISKSFAIRPNLKPYQAAKP